MLKTKVDVQVEPQSQNLAYQWHQEEEKIDFNGQHTRYKSTKDSLFYCEVIPENTHQTNCKSKHNAVESHFLDFAYLE